MVEWIVLGLLIGLLVWRGMAALRTEADARRRGLPLAARLRWALLALVDSSRYWWAARLDLQKTDEADALLASMARAYGLAHITNVRCPLCESEIEDALSVTADGMLAVRSGATCPRCDFRLDACRHCAHFLPAKDPYATFNRQGDVTHGRCNRYRALQPVREAYPHLADRLEALGYEALPAPKPIQDSYFPLPECTGFTLQLERLRGSKIPWLTRQRLALIRLHQDRHAGQLDLSADTPRVRK